MTKQLYSTSFFCDAATGIAGARSCGYNRPLAYVCGTNPHSTEGISSLRPIILRRTLEAPSALLRTGHKTRKSPPTFKARPDCRRDYVYQEPSNDSGPTFVIPQQLALRIGSTKPRLFSVFCYNLFRAGTDALVTVSHGVHGVHFPPDF
jgi:hypothetical protein